MTALQKKLLAGLKKTMARAETDLERDSALLKSRGGISFRLLIQRHKSIIELCEKEISKLKA